MLLHLLFNVEKVPFEDLDGLLGCRGGLFLLVYVDAHFELLDGFLVVLLTGGELGDLFGDLLLVLFTFDVDHSDFKLFKLVVAPFESLLVVLLGLLEESEDVIDTLFLFRFLLFEGHTVENLVEFRIQLSDHPSHLFVQLLQLIARLLSHFHLGEALRHFTRVLSLIPLGYLPLAQIGSHTVS